MDHELKLATARAFGREHGLMGGLARHEPEEIPTCYDMAYVHGFAKGLAMRKLLAERGLHRRQELIEKRDDGFHWYVVIEGDLWGAGVESNYRKAQAAADDCAPGDLN